jgi:hypothetical protein
MTKSISVLQKKRGRGRPATGQDPTMSIRLSDKIKAEIDEWASRQDDKPPRSIAIRHLVEIALASAKKSPKQPANEAFVKRREERWADKISDLGWRQRLDNLLDCAARSRGESFAKTEAWELFGIRRVSRKPKAD